MVEGLGRRFFLKMLGAAGLVTSTTTVACKQEEDDTDGSEDALTLTGFEYVIVGSGAGGAPLASNLARAGHKVLLLEAGDDRGTTDNEEVPAFHLRSTEDEAMRWDYYVKHYDDEARQAKDSKMTWETADGSFHVGAKPAGGKARGILYPRAGTLGGCTSHNAMVTVYPHESDWERIASLTGDHTWGATNMRKYYQLLERCEYLRTSDSTAGHGTKGWLGVSKADPTIALKDVKLLSIVKAAATTMGQSLIGDFNELLGILKGDLNAPGKTRDTSEGCFQVPMAISGGRRSGPRDLLVDTVKKGFPLTIKTNCLATRVLFNDDATPKAIGVEFVEGKSLYAADPRAPGGRTPISASQKNKVMVSREVILAAGAYNTPQLLKLSGVGPKDELAKLEIPVKVDLPGVGTNLQDRYEVGVVSEMKSDLSTLDGCTFAHGADPCLDKWRRGEGPYTTNGIAVAMIKKSSVSKGDADLIVFGAPGAFRGYFPGYSEKATADHKHFTWAVLKAHTDNQAGSVTLRSADPRDVPEIEFKYFDTGTTAGDAHERDLQAVAEGVELARKAGHTIGNLMLDDVPLLGGKFEEQVPGPALQGNDLKDWVKNEAWGHHASCTCPIGADGDPNAVLDGKLRVRGTTGLRVVDASVFPKIPGFFIVVPIYMVSEKATDDILGDLGEARRVS